MRRGAVAVLATLVLSTTAPQPRAAAPAPGAAPDPASISLTLLPEGPNRSLVVQRCGLCHPVEMIVAQRRTPAEWQRQVARMLDFGAQITPDEQDQVLDYLEGTFGRE